MSSFQSKFLKLVLAEVEDTLLKHATPVEGAPTFDTPESARDQ
jgi:hypothetical protein